MKQIYDLSAGIPAYIVKIFQEAQTQAILSGIEKITYESIKQAVSYLGIEVPKVYSRGGTSISDFTVSEIEFGIIGINDTDDTEIEVEYQVIEDNKVITLPRFQEMEQTVETMIREQEESEVPLEATTKPVKRFYATQRGRKQADRDKADLVAIWKANESAEHFIKTIENYQMIERRCY